MTTDKKAKIVCPMAFRPSAARELTLHYLAFPREWKTALLELDDMCRAHGRNPEHSLPTRPLKKLLNAYLPDICHIGVLKHDSYDQDWLTAVSELTLAKAEQICDVLATWISGWHIDEKLSPLATEMVATRREAILDSIDAATLVASYHTKKLRLLQSTEPPVASAETYAALPLLALNTLVGETLTLQGAPLTFYHAGGAELMSLPIKGENDDYSITINLSVQTVPPEREPLLKVHLGIRRFAMQRTKDEPVEYIPNGITAYIQCEDKRSFYPLKIEGQGAPSWNVADARALKTFYPGTLPPIDELLRAPVNYQHILLTYKDGMRHFRQPNVGKGLSLSDKEELFTQLREKFLAAGLIRPERIEAEHVANLTQTTYFTAQENLIVAEPSATQAEQLRLATDAQGIRFVFYGDPADCITQQIFTNITAKLQKDFAGAAATNIIILPTSITPTREMANPLELSDYPQNNAKVKKKAAQKAAEARAREIKNELTATADDGYRRANIFCLHGQDFWHNYTDPKAAIRHGFATAHQLVQFIDPYSPNYKKYREELAAGTDTNSKKTKSIIATLDSTCNSALNDLYRQLGITTLHHFKDKISSTLQSMAGISFVGVELLKNVTGRLGSRVDIPLFLKYQPDTGAITVRSRLFDALGYGPEPLSYSEALFALAELYDSEDVSRKLKDCAGSSADSIREQLDTLKYWYQDDLKNLLILVDYSSEFSYLWKGLTDKELSAASGADYGQHELFIRKDEAPVALQGTGVRIVRVRSTSEVPDYYVPGHETADGLKHSTIQGIFKYDRVYYSIAGTPQTHKDSVGNSRTKSRITHTDATMTLMDMIELYPVQMQKDDEPIIARWMQYVDNLRTIAIQFDGKATKLPLPLHLAAKMDEYIFRP